MEVLSKQIEFPANITPFPLIPFNVTPNNRLPRTLVRRGELVHIIYRGDDAKLTFGKKATIKKNIYCFLFTDIIILTKKKRFELLISTSSGRHSIIFLLISARNLFWSLTIVRGLCCSSLRAM